MNVPTFGEMVRDLRLKRGWTLKEAAEHLGFSFAFIGKIETGLRSMPMDQLDKWIKVLKPSHVGLFRRLAEETHATPELLARIRFLEGEVNANSEMLHALEVRVRELTSSLRELPVVLRREMIHVAMDRGSFVDWDGQKAVSANHEAPSIVCDLINCAVDVVARSCRAV